MLNLPFYLAENQDLILLPKWRSLAVSEMSQVILAYLQWLPWKSTYLLSAQCSAQQPHACFCHVSTTQSHNYLKFHPRSVCSLLSKELLKSNEAFSHPEVGIHFHAFPRKSRNNIEWRPALFWPG